VNDVNLNLTITAKRTWQAIQDGYPVIVNTGGARSGKTFGTMQLLLFIACKKPFTRISIVSRSLPHVKKGVFRDFQILLNEGFKYCGEMRWTDFTFYFKNGSYMEFFGLEDPDKAHGPGRDILFINEANFVPKQVYDQLAMRTTGTILLDLNPSEFNSWVYEIAENKANKNIHSTYLDNISNLSPQQVSFIEGFKDLPESFMWEVYGLGKRGASKELIYTGWKLCNELPDKGDVFFGLDFGYTVPTSLVKCEHYDGSNYVQESIYLSGITTPELIERMKAAGVTTEMIYCDAAEPDRIDELIKAGFNAKKAVKDVVAGIVKVKSYPLYLTTDSKNLISEMNGYKWATDNNGDILDDKPVKANDHATDAMRYAIMTHLNAPTLQYWAI
jgi:phage terminase large subunit